MAFRRKEFHPEQHQSGEHLPTHNSDEFGAVDVVLTAESIVQRALILPDSERERVLRAPRHGMYVSEPLRLVIKQVARLIFERSELQE